MFSLTVFKNLFDTDVDKRMEFSSWENFVTFLFNVSELPGSKFDRNKKDAGATPLITPAVFKPESSRKNDNVLRWGRWAAIDVDEYTVVKSVKEDMIEQYGEYSFVCYSTASSTKQSPKFRLAFQLDEEVPTDKIKHFWYALNTELDSIGDRQTKDKARMYYAPAKYKQAYNFIWENKGQPISVYGLLEKHEYKEKRSAQSLMDGLPPAFRDAIIAERKSKLNNVSFKWTGYLDCPFWPKRLESQYKEITETGWYNMSYRIMVAIAASALDKGYPITAKEISILMRQFDRDTGNWYGTRPIEREAQTALDYAFRNLL